MKACLTCKHWDVKLNKSPCAGCDNAIPGDKYGHWELRPEKPEKDGFEYVELPTADCRKCKYRNYIGHKMPCCDCCQIGNGKRLYFKPREDADE